MPLEYICDSTRRKHQTPGFLPEKIRTWKWNKWPLHFTYLFGFGFCIESKKAIVLSHIFSWKCIPVVPCNLSNEYLLLSLQDLNLSKVFYSYCTLKNPSFIHGFFFLFLWTILIYWLWPTQCLTSLLIIGLLQDMVKVWRGRKRQNTPRREVGTNMGTTMEKPEVTTMLQSFTALSHA